MKKNTHNLWHTHSMQNQQQSSTSQHHITTQSIALANQHYENFPVASVFLPKDLRAPIGLIYSFARQADDFADEGHLSTDERLALLDGFRDELDLLQAYIKPKTPFFLTLGEMIKARKLPYAPFFDLLDAFRQDIIKTRYQHYGEVLDYCTRSANPVGRLMLHLYGQSNENNIVLSDHICSALQMINFLQDIAIDFNKNDGKQRIYMCQDELAQFGITEQDLYTWVNHQAPINAQWQAFMQFNLNRVQALMQAGKPLGRILTGRIGFEMRMIIAGGERIIHKINVVKGDIFNQRPRLHGGDWLVIFLKALFRI
jgi:squalene synthase HpnC